MTKNVARTDATGKGELLPEILAWSSSLGLDRSMIEHDLLGSAAHVTMLAKAKLVPADEGRALRDALLAMRAEAKTGAPVVPDGEEDVHMAVEAELGRRVGAAAARLHTARSRNDQVALDLRLFVRDQGRAVLAEVAGLAAELADRGEREIDLVLPSYTHRQRAQPISGGFLFGAWAQPILRAGDALAFALAGVDRSPLGSGAVSGTSLPIDRALVARLLGFARPTASALDTVGDRDFALDWLYAGTRVLVALSRMATDVIDFASQEFGFVRLGDAVSTGSSMMPHKKNPDVFEIVRGKAGRQIGDLCGLLAVVKGLPIGYGRDLQEDRRSVLETAPHVRESIRVVRATIPHLAFDRARCAAAVADGSTQATDLAEALVRRGVAFRDAYRAVGALVRAAADEGVALADVSEAAARAAHPALDAEARKVLDPRTAMRAKESDGGTGPAAVARQLAEIRSEAARLAVTASRVPTLDALAAGIVAEPLA